MTTSPDEGPLTLTLSEAERDVLVDAVAWMLADFLVKNRGDLDPPEVRVKFDTLTEVGNKLGMNL